MFYTFLECSRMSVYYIVSLQCDARVRLLHLVYDIDFTREKQQNTLSMFYTVIKLGFSTNQSARRVLS